MNHSLTATAAVMLMLGGCASTPNSETNGVYDPLEPLNRQVFAFNEAADRAVIGPVAEGYATITPGFVRQGVRNVLSNLNSPVVFVNDVLQGEPGRAGDTASRFVLNSTFGILGLFDVAASEAGIQRHSEDFGQTLAVWGVDSGPYLVLPLLGPTNLRDGIGMGVDNAFDPFTWTEFEDEDADTYIGATRTVLGILEARTQFDSQLETLRQQPEPYVALRRAYTARREAAIRNGREEEDPYTDLPDFDDFE